MNSAAGTSESGQMPRRRAVAFLRCETSASGAPADKTDGNPHPNSIDRLYQQAERVARANRLDQSPRKRVKHPHGAAPASVHRNTALSFSQLLHTSGRPSGPSPPFELASGAPSVWRGSARPLGGPNAEQIKTHVHRKGLSETGRLGCPPAPRPDWPLLLLIGGGNPVPIRLPPVVPPPAVPPPCEFFHLLNKFS